MANGTGITRRKTSQLALLSFLFVPAFGCGDTASLAPTPLPSSPPPVNVTPVRLEGHVLDEHGQPVDGARITPLYLPGGAAPSATADHTGSFSITVGWPANWPGITLRVERDGYEFADVPVQADDASAVRINIYKTLAISAGESIQATLSLRVGDCGFEPYCRRAIVNAPSGQLVDIEVIATEGQEYVGLALRDQLIWGRTFPTRLTAPGGAEVWIFARQVGRVTLRAVGR